MSVGDGLQFNKHSPRCFHIDAAVTFRVFIAAIAVNLRERLSAGIHQALKGAFDVVAVERDVVEAEVGEPCRFVLLTRNLKKF